MTGGGCRAAGVGRRFRGGSEPTVARGRGRAGSFTAAAWRRGARAGSWGLSPTPGFWQKPRPSRSRGKPETAKTPGVPQSPPTTPSASPWHWSMGVPALAALMTPSSFLRGSQVDRPVGVVCRVVGPQSFGERARRQARHLIKTGAFERSRVKLQRRNGRRKHDGKQSGPAEGGGPEHQHPPTMPASFRSDRCGFGSRGCGGGDDVQR